LHATATINEPWCVAWLSHFLGVHAPGYRDARAAARAMHHVLLAHGTAIDALRAEGGRNLGIVLNLEKSEAVRRRSRRTRRRRASAMPSSTAGISAASSRASTPRS
jgi:beta-glucosidase/6-phospho-beta-glucosidase/beta-galactosidase